MVTILARSRWTSTAPKGSAFTWSRIRGIVCHYPAMGKSVGVLSEAQETARLRGWRNYHVGSLGWADIGYNYAIGQSGRVYSLRGDRVGGHAVGHNSTTVGVLFIVGDNEPLTAAARASFRALRTTLRLRGAGSGVWGHTEMSGNSTRCPGPFIMADIRSGVLTSTAPVAVPGPGTSVPAPTPTPPSNSGLADVDKSQRWLAALGYNVGPIDGVYGKQTSIATRAFQTHMGITPADGRPGPATRHALEDTVAKIDDLEKKIDRLAESVDAYGKQIHWRTDTVGTRVLDEPVALKGDNAGQTGRLRGIREYYAHDIARIVKLLGEVKSLITSKRITDAEVARIADAVAKKTSS